MHLQAGSLQFLADQGFDFNKCIRQGISSMPATLRDEALARVQQQQQEPPHQYHEAALTKTDDILFVQETTSQILAWLQV